MVNSTLEASILKEIEVIFKEYSKENKLNVDQLGNVFKACQSPQPNFKIREILIEYDKNSDGVIDFEEFIAIFEAADTNKVWGSKLRENIKSRANVSLLKTHEKSAEGTKHSLVDGEIKAFAKFISFILRENSNLGSRIPIKADKQDLFDKISDGVILCNLANILAENTIDQRTINYKKLHQFTMTENLNLALNSYRALGLHIINVDAQDFISKTAHLVLGVLWQIIKRILLKNINVQVTHGLACLLNDDELLADLQVLTPEEILLRWVNYHLVKSGSNRIIQNYGNDFQDSEVLAIISKSILPVSYITSVSDIMKIKDLKLRAEQTLANFEKADVDVFITAEDIIGSNSKLILAFVAHLFNNYPCLEETEIVVEEESREQKTLRNWVNSLGVKPRINSFYSDVSDGIALLHLINVIKPGTVDVKKINYRPMKPSRAKLLKLENCNYAIECGKKLGLSLYGTSGSNIVERDQKFILGIFSQLMRKYTVDILQSLTSDGKTIDDSSIIKWANEKCPIKITSFKDQSISTSKPLCALIEAIKENTIQFSYLTEGITEEDKLSNAIYTLSCARKIGATVYLLPEDIVELNSKMITTMYACLMARDIKNNL